MFDVRLFGLEFFWMLAVGIWMFLLVIRPRLIFITGTDTGVGKTLLTSLLLAHLRSHGIRALALKPFCSGSRSDALLLRSLMDQDLTLDEINPFYFPEPIAPLVAARKHRRCISLRQVLSHISRITHHASLIPPTLSPSHAPTLLIEGAGGLLAPLTEDCNALDIIRRLDCEVLVAATNKLGTINHTLLTIGALQAGAPLPRAPRSKLTGPIYQLPSAICQLPSSRFTRVVLMNCRSPDASASSNPRILSELLAPVSVHTFPFLGATACRLQAIRRYAAVLQGKLAALCRKP